MKPEGNCGSAAEAWLSSLDPIGWRFGLERIQALLDRLGRPQLEFDSIHVVGTNGKSSVTAMTTALIEASGRRAGCYLSPHRKRWSERVWVGSREIDPDAFQSAVDEVAEAVGAVQPHLDRDERITQFEASTAVAFVALAHAGVEVAVIEAGLGGRLDATNVLNSKTTVLTSVGLDHTAWLGDTVAEIANEKLAVLRPGSSLVLGQTSEVVAEIARRTAADRDCRVIDPAPVPPTISLAAPYLRRNLSVALAAAATALDEVPGDKAVQEASRLPLPGRFDVREGTPTVILDAAHNPDGAAALAEAVAVRFPGRDVVGCIAVLADKDAQAIVAALATVIRTAVCTEVPAERLVGVGRPGAASVPAAELELMFADRGVPAFTQVDPVLASAHAKRLAAERGGVALIVGSHYLLSY